MQVTNVEVCYDRKRQPAQYESAGASVRFTASIGATVGQDEDHVEVAKRLLADAKTLVLTELGVVPAGTSASAHDRAPAASAAGAEAAPAGGKGKKGKKGEADAAPAGETRQISTGESRVGPEDAPDGGAPSTAAQAGAGNPDIPEDPKPAAVATTAAAKPQALALTAAEVQAQVAGYIKEKKIDVATVKETSRKYGVERIADLPAEKLAAYKGDIDAAVKKFSTGGPDI
jgi:hypothetical protein